MTGKLFYSKELEDTTKLIKTDLISKFKKVSLFYDIINSLYKDTVSGFSAAKLTYAPDDPALIQLKQQIERIKEKNTELKATLLEIRKVKYQDSEMYLLLMFAELINLIKFCLEEQGTVPDWGLYSLIMRKCRSSKINQ